MSMQSAAAPAPVKKNLVTRFDMPGNPLVLQYVMPTNTLKGRSYECASHRDAVKLGLWSLRIMASKGVAKIEFMTSDQPVGPRDALQITFFSAESRLKAQPMIESVFRDFVRNVDPATGVLKNIKLSLVNGELDFSDEQFDLYAAVYIKQGAQHHVAAIKAMIQRFNEAVAGPDGGEVRYDGYKNENGTGTVMVKLFNQCSGCPTSPMTVHGRLLPMLNGRLDKVVHKLEIIPA